MFKYNLNIHYKFYHKYYIKIIKNLTYYVKLILYSFKSHSQKN